MLERSVREHDAELGQIEGDGWRKRGTTALAAIGAVAPVTFWAVVAAVFALLRAPFAVALVLLAAAQQELDALAARGVRMRGNAFSAIVLVKGELNANELAGGELLAGADGTALAAALERLGYAPEEFCALSAIAGPEGEGAAPEVASGRPLPPALFREALEALDPEAVVLLDDTAASLMREAYAEELARIEQFDMAMLAPGLVAHVLGRRVLALDGFEAALADGRAKQRMWAYLKQLSPLGAPY